MRKLTVFLVLCFSAVFADVLIPLFGGSITIFNNSDGSFTVGTEKKTAENIERHTKFTIRNGTVDNFEFSTNGTETPVSTAAPHKRLRPSQQRPKSDVLNALLSMFGRF